jgi:hypothetical protein
VNNNSGEGEVFIHLAPESIIHISPESVIHILRNDYSLAPEYARIPGMLNIDVDEIVEVNYLSTAVPGEGDAVELRFKNGVVTIYKGQELSEVLEILKHWTPPTA